MSEEPLIPDSPRKRRLAAFGLMVAVAAAYSNSLRVPFLFDDRSAIEENPSIRHLIRLAEALHPPVGSSVGGRPILNLSFAVNYAWGGLNLGTYHLFNTAVHLIAGLMIFGIVRRTLVSPAFQGLYRNAAFTLALLVSAAWLLHPLQTEAVTYISQRAESLAGMWVLVALYAFIRGARQDPYPAIPADATTPGASQAWLAVSCLSCLLAVATKEVSVAGPVLILLYDRVFVSGSFTRAIGRRRRYYGALASAWLLLGCLIAGSDLGNRGVGFHSEVTALAYAMTESKVVVLYLARALWPHPLVFDYGPGMIATRFGQVAPYATILAILGALAALAWRRSRPLGFAAVSVFVLLAPTSSFVPVAFQPMAESRMYLPLAPVITVIVLGVHSLARKWSAPVLALAIAILVFLTVKRNHDYRSALSLWEDTVAKQPGNSRGQYCLAVELAKQPAGSSDAIAHYVEALRIRPDYAEAHCNLALELAKVGGRETEAIAHFDEALRIDPANADFHFCYGSVLSKIPGHTPEAARQYEEALRLKPDYPEAENDLAILLISTPGRETEAISRYEHVLKLHPEIQHVRVNLALAHFEFGNRLSRSAGHLREAIAQYEQALVVKPDYAEDECNLGVAYAYNGQVDEGLRHLKAALRLDPANATARRNLEALSKIGR